MDARDRVASCGEHRPRMTSWLDCRRGHALDGHPGARHTRAMAHVRIALLIAMALALAGCAATPSRPLDYPPDGKPKVLPCMAGGLLCSPQG